MTTRVKERKGKGKSRRQRICELLMERGYADVADLGKQLNVNAATIRRDLDSEPLPEAKEILNSLGIEVHVANGA
jgi:DeoR/GlpR family transcriptional regulator of sugar metabolism